MSIAIEEKRRYTLYMNIKQEAYEKGYQDSQWWINAEGIFADVESEHDCENQEYWNDYKQGWLDAIENDKKGV